MLTQAAADLPVSPNKIPQAPPNTHMCINTAFQRSGNIPKIQLKLAGFLYPALWKQ